MHAKLRITLTAAVLVTAVPAAGIASAHEGQRGGKDPQQSGGHKHHGGKGGKRCDRPRGFQAQGLLAAGSRLEQVAGADTARRGDDRFSGTVIVEVRRGGRRQRHGDKGTAPAGTLTSFTVDAVRALGTTTDSDTAPLPALGTRVLLVGTIAKAACPTPAPTTSPEPTVTPDADYPDGTTATRARHLSAEDEDDPALWGEDPDDTSDRSSGGADNGKGGGAGKGGDPASDDDDPADDDYPSSDYPTATPKPTTPASPTTATASTAVIKLVVFKSGSRSRR